MQFSLVKASLFRFALLAAVWLVLTGGEAKGLLIGAGAVPAAVWMSLRLLPAGQGLRPWPLIRHLPRFLGGSVRGGVDVARRALAPSMRLNPGWIAVPVSLPDGGRVALGAELSLMPGTLAAGTQEGRLLVHVLDRDAGYEHAIPQEEAAIAAMIGRRAERAG